ncbi:MAG: type II toxin-antitoxin system RelE/ParE family toxin [Steroidobacteraceae bacterium]
MARVIRRPRARLDLLEIWRYIADEAGETRADQYLRRLNDIIDYLAQQPLMGRARPELGPVVRSFPRAAYVVFYEPIDDGIELLRVIRADRDLDTAWNEPFNEPG